MKETVTTSHPRRAAFRVDEPKPFCTGTAMRSQDGPPLDGLGAIVAGGRARPQFPADLVAHVEQRPGTVLSRPSLGNSRYDRAISTMLHFGPTAMKKAITLCWQLPPGRDGAAGREHPTSGE